MEVPTHLDDGLLQALLDRELDAAAAGPARLHVESCAECRGRLKSLRQGAELLERVLPALDHALAPIPAEHVIARARGGGEQERHHRLRWAAVIALMVVGAGALYAVPGSPLRRWIDRLVRHPVEEKNAATGATAGIALPAGDRFRIVFAVTPSSAGTVTIRLTDDSIVEARRLDGTARFVAELEGLRIEMSGTTADIAIGIPRAAPWVEVSADGRRIFLKDGAHIVTAAAPDSLGRYMLVLRSH